MTNALIIKVIMNYNKMDTISLYCDIETELGEDRRSKQPYV